METSLRLVAMGVSVGVGLGKLWVSVARFRWKLWVSLDDGCNCKALNVFDLPREAASGETLCGLKEGNDRAFDGDQDMMSCYSSRELWVLPHIWRLFRFV